MKKTAMTCAGTLIALLALVGLAPAANAYPDVTIDLTVDRQVLYGAETYTATGTSNVDCAWTLEWDGEVHTGTGADGSPYTTTYTAPEVEEITEIPLHGTCGYTEPSGRVAARAAAGPATWERTIIITVLPQGDGTVVPPTDNGGNLPNTGGPNLLFLIAGVGLLVLGAGAVTVARRRAENVDIATGQA